MRQECCIMWWGSASLVLLFPDRKEFQRDLRVRAMIRSSTFVRVGRFVRHRTHLGNRASEIPNNGEGGSPLLSEAVTDDAIIKQLDQLSGLLNHQ